MMTTDTVGGVWRYSLELTTWLAAHGVRVVLVTMGPRPAPNQCREATIAGAELVATDLPLDWLAPTPAALRDAVQALVGLAAQHRVDTVHLHTPALIEDATREIPVVAVVHSCVGTWWRTVHGGALPPELAWCATAVARGLVVADAVIAPSQSFASLLRAQYAMRRDIAVVLNGRTPIAASAPRRGHVFTAGRLWDPGKNVAVIDAAVGLLDVPVFAAGPLAGPHGASTAWQHLRCLGSLDEAAMAAEYAAAGIFVSMALYEPFGLAVLEAAQAGCALILSDIPTFRELWDGAARFVEPSDAPGLAAAIRDCLATPGWRDRRGMLARQRATQFTADTMATATWRIHRALAAASTDLTAV